MYPSLFYQSNSWINHATMRNILVISRYKRKELLIFFSLHAVAITTSSTLNTLRRRKMTAIWQTTFSNTRVSVKKFVFWLKAQWNLFPRAQLTISHHLFRKWLGSDQATSHYLNQWWLPLLTHICVTRPGWVVAAYLTTLQHSNAVLTITVSYIGEIERYWLHMFIQSILRFELTHYRCVSVHTTHIKTKTLKQAITNSFIITKWGPLTGSNWQIIFLISVPSFHYDGLAFAKW